MHINQNYVLKTLQAFVTLFFVAQAGIAVAAPISWSNAVNTTGKSQLLSGTVVYCSKRRKSRYDHERRRGRYKHLSVFQRWLQRY